VSTIDQYEHELLTFIECPSEFDFIGSSATRQIAIYRLGQDIPDDETDFDGKRGDILVGGGSGEAESLRISYPEADYFFTLDDWDEFEDYDELFKTFWSPSFAYKMGDGFRKQGWSPNTNLELWLAKTVIDMLLSDGKPS
jgi:hypothetical protein